MKRYKQILAAGAAAFFLLSPAASVLAGAPDTVVRIGIREGQTSVAVAGPFGVGVYRNGSLWKKYHTAIKE